MRGKAWQQIGYDIPACENWNKAKAMGNATAYDLLAVFCEDYDFAKKIFGDVEKELCPHSFAFGKDGKRRKHTGLKDPSQQDHGKEEASNFQSHGYFHELKRVSS